MFAVKLDLSGEGAVECERALDSLLKAFLIEHWEHTGKTSIHIGNVRVRFILIRTCRR